MHALRAKLELLGPGRQISIWGRRMAGAQSQHLWPGWGWNSVSVETLQEKLGNREGAVGAEPAAVTSARSFRSSWASSWRACHLIGALHAAWLPSVKGFWGLCGSCSLSEALPSLCRGSPLSATCPFGNLVKWKSRSVESDSFATPCCPPGSSVCGNFQTRILKWVAFPSPGDLPEPRIEPRSPALQADSLPPAPPGKPSLFPISLEF